MVSVSTSYDARQRKSCTKIPKSKLVTDQQKTRLEAEKFILQSVPSPFLCRGFAVIETTDDIAILSEYIQGRMLYECVWKYRDTGRCPEIVAKFFAAQLVLALEDLHAHGYIHRDLKSGNILVENDGFVKVIDFGLASTVVDEKRNDKDDDKRTQSICGTHYIMAPEMMIQKPYGKTVDWWSLGVIIYEMVIGHPPWKYQCSSDSTMDEYLQSIIRSAGSLFQRTNDNHEQELSSELQSLIRGLLMINPCERLGRNGAIEVRTQAWFRDINWEQLKSKDPAMTVPYNAQTDYNAARIRPPLGQMDDLSSAESINSEENATYFAEF